MKKLFSVKLVLFVALSFVLVLTQMGVSFADDGTPAPTQELFGHVTLVEGYALPSYTGCHALLQLSSGQTIAVMTTDPGLENLLEHALTTGNLTACWAQKLTNPIAPMGGTWTVDVYNTNCVILYNTK